MNKKDSYEFVFINDDMFLYFIHYREQGNIRRGTICQLYTGNGTKMQSQGIASLAPTDEYDDTVGRMLSLTRALNNLSNDLITQVWEKYYDCFGNEEYNRYQKFLADNPQLA